MVLKKVNKLLMPGKTDQEKEKIHITNARKAQGDITKDINKY